MTFRVVLFSFAAGALSAQTPASWKELVQRGKELEAHYRVEDAIEAYRMAIRLAPNEVVPHLALGQVLMNGVSTLVPPGGAPMPENLAAAMNAEKEFLRVVELAPRNVTALRSLGWLKFQDSQRREAPAEKQRAANESRGWFQKALAIDPADGESHAGLGGLTASSLAPEWRATRANLKMRPEDPGPFPDARVRAALQSRYGPTIDDGLAHLRRALELDPRQTAAAGFMTMLLYQAADLSDTPAEYRRLTAQADDVATKALAAVRQGTGNGGTSADAPPPPPPNMGGAAPQRITVDMNVQKEKLIEHPDPAYPPLAKQAGIQGTVRFTVVIDRGGNVLERTLASGHPMLVRAASVALSYWKYQPTLLNGEPVEVSTQVDVEFRIP